MNTFGERLRWLRESNRPKYSQEALGRMIGQTKESAQAYVSKLEHNNIKPKIEELIAIADIYKVSVDWLLCRDSDQAKKKKTMFDILSALFSLEDVGVELGEKREIIPDYNLYTEKMYDVEVVTNYISFKYQHLNEFLSDWKKMIELSQKDELYKQLYSQWKETELKKAKDKFADGSLIINDIPFPF